ncbi:MAG: YcxB family protein [Dysgonomonas sp.]
MINIDIDLSENDLLNLQLFFASSDEEMKRQRKKEKYRILGLSALCSIMLFFEEGYRTYSYFFLGSTTLFLLVYPWWSAWFYKRMYKKQVSTFFKDKIPYRITLVLCNEYIDIESPKGNSRIYINNIKSITETGEYFFIVTDQKTSITIPRNKVVNAKGMQEQLEYYKSNYSVLFNQDLTWKWK